MNTTCHTPPGARFGRLVVLERASSQRVTVRCDCGKQKTVQAANIFHGRTKSCGCARAEATSARRKKHGMTDQREYRAWSHMKARCATPTDNSFKNYGARGIKVCDRWASSFENFSSDMGPCPPGFSLDRIDVEGDYTPENCRWADTETQSNNQRKTVYVEHDGRRQSVAQWARELGIQYQTLYRRVVKMGEKPPEAFRGVS